MFMLHVQQCHNLSFFKKIIKVQLAYIIILVTEMQCSDLTVIYFTMRSPKFTSKSNTHLPPCHHLSPCKLITILLTIFPVLYTISLWLILKLGVCIYLLFPFTLFTISPNNLPAGNHQFVLCFFLSHCKTAFLLVCFLAQ